MHPENAAPSRAPASLGARVALLPLRAFLGGTFVFAGLQKLANPNFFNRASPISIWSQLAGAERTSPIHALLGHLLQIATPLGILIAVGEVAIGLGILLGLLTRVAAAAGMALSLGLFLTVSFHSNPYYTGSDIVFFFALTPLLLAGPGELLALDPWLRRHAAGESRIEAARARAWPAGAAPLGNPVLARRQLLSTTVTAVGALAVATMGLDALFGRVAGRAATAARTPELGAGGGAGTGRTAVPGTSNSPGTSGGSAQGKPAPRAHPPGQAIGSASNVPIGGAAAFQDPATGDPALVLQPTSGHFVAFDAVCPHAGCTVGYSPANRLLICPCHGSEFNAATGALVSGPAPRGLRSIALAEGSDGQLYAV